MDLKDILNTTKIIQFIGQIIEVLPKIDPLVGFQETHRNAKLKVKGISLKCWEIFILYFKNNTSTFFFLVNFKNEMFNITYRDKMEFVYCTLHIRSYLVQFRVSIGMGRKHCVFWCYIDLWNNLSISLQVRVHFSDFEIAKRFGNTIFSFIYSNTFITYYTRMKERKLY